MPESGIQQEIRGSFNAQAAEGRTATVTVHQGVEPAQITEKEHAAAAALLAHLPLDTVPGLGALLAGSLMPYLANPES